MILDTLEQSSTYEAISPRLVKAFNFLRQMSDQFPLGRHEIDGDDVYAMVQSFATTPVETRKYEAHRQYIDVQYLITGREVIYWAPLPLLTEVLMPFDEKQDAAGLHHALPNDSAVPKAACREQAKHEHG